MARAYDESSSLRFGRGEIARGSFVALLFSLLAHLGAWGGYQEGKKLGCGREVHPPKWIQQAVEQHLLQPPCRSPFPSPDHVRGCVPCGTPTQPKMTKYYSNKNSRAANRDVGTANIPEIRGTQPDAHGPAAAAGRVGHGGCCRVEPTASATPDGAATDPDSDATGALVTDGSVGGTQSGATPQPLPPTALATLTDAIAGAVNAAAIASPDKAAAAVGSPARQMTLSVDLQELGVVNMSMTLSGRSLTLRMTAQLAETARRLQGDHDGSNTMVKVT